MISPKMNLSRMNIENNCNDIVYNPNRVARSKHIFLHTCPTSEQPLTIGDLIKASLSMANVEFGIDDDICAMNNMNNKEKFCHLLRSTGREGIETVISELEDSGFFEAPASANHHLNCKGGLLQHSLNVCETALAMRSFLEEKGQIYAHEIPRDRVIIASLLHDVCKCDIYRETLVNKRNDDGKWEKVPGYIVDCDELPVGHGEKSVIILLLWGLKLTRDEILAIRWHMHAWDLAFQSYEQKMNIQKARETSPLCILIQCADGISAGILEAK